jgi:hypothetical protein
MTTVVVVWAAAFVFTHVLVVLTSWRKTMVSNPASRLGVPRVIAFLIPPFSDDVRTGKFSVRLHVTVCCLVCCRAGPHSARLELFDRIRIFWYHNSRISTLRSRVLIPCIWG